VRQAGELCRSLHGSGFQELTSVGLSGRALAVTANVGQYCMSARGCLHWSSNTSVAANGQVKKDPDPLAPPFYRVSL